MAGGERRIVDLDKTTTINTNDSIFINNSSIPKQIDYSYIQSNILTASAQQTETALTPIRSRVSTLESENVAVKGRVTTLENLVLEHSVKLSSLSIDMTTTKNDVSNLQKTVASLSGETYSTKPSSIYKYNATINPGSTYSIVLSYPTQTQLPSKVVVVFATPYFNEDDVLRTNGIISGADHYNVCSIEIMSRDKSTSVFDGYINSFYYSGYTNNNLPQFIRNFMPNINSSSVGAFTGSGSRNTTTPTRYWYDGNSAVFGGFFTALGGDVIPGDNQLTGGDVDIQVDSFKYTTSQVSCVVRNTSITSRPLTLKLEAYAYVFK